MLVPAIVLGWFQPSAEIDRQYVPQYEGGTFNGFLALLAYLEVAIDAHEKLFIVGSTIAIAVFTGTLYRATSGLLDAAERQKADMRESLEIARKSSDAASLQARTAIAERMPVVAWVGQKLVEFNTEGVAIRDPAAPGVPPPIFRPVMTIRNTGPTRVYFHQFGLRCEVREQLPPDPFYDGMALLGALVLAEHDQSFASGEPVILSEAQIQEIGHGATKLWVYGFLTYNDFLDEAHQIGFCFRWDTAAGLVNDGPPAYNFHRHQKRYT